MSLDLAVRCTRPFPIAHLLAEGWKTLGDLLSMKEPPLVTAELLDEEENLRPVKPDHVCEAGDPVLYLGMEGHPEKVQLVFYDIGEGPFDIPDSEKGLHAGIVAVDDQSGWGGALRLSFGAAMVIALARIQGTTIKDFKLNLSDRQISTPDELMETLRVREPAADTRGAADKVFSSTPLNVLDGPRKRLIEIESEIDGLMVDLFVPVKTRGVIEPAVFERLYRLLDEAALFLHHDEAKRKSLAGIVLLIREELIKEIKRVRDPVPLIMEVERLRDRLKSLWPERSDQKI